MAVQILGPNTSQRIAPYTLDFWFGFDNSLPNKPPVAMGYTAGYVGGPFILFETNPGSIAAHRTLLESFLLTVYGAGVNLGGDSVFNLDADMKAAGGTVISTMYRHLDEIDPVTGIPTGNPARALDFLVLTQAKKREYTQPDGEKINLMNLGATDPRPLIADVEDTGDRSLLFRVVRQLGIYECLKYLYSVGGITFVELCDHLKEAMPDRTQRAAYLPGLTAFLRLRRNQIFTPEQIDAFLA